MEILLEMGNVNYKTICKHLFRISKDLLTGNCEDHSTDSRFN